MKWNTVLHSIEEDRGILYLEEDEVFIRIPLKYLPKECRVGDVFEVDISFSPFKTLNRIANYITRNNES